MFCYNPFGYASGIVTTLGNEFSEICNKYSEQRGGGVRGSGAVATCYLVYILINVFVSV